MTTASAGLERECETFTLLLTRKSPTQYVVRKYVDGHRARPDLAAVAGFERVLLDHATRGPIRARLADAYARRLFPRGNLRKKLVLLLAILETSPGFHRDVDLVPARSQVSALLTLATVGTTAVVVTLLGLMCFSALRLVSGEARPR